MPQKVHSVSIVIPVFKGETTIENVVTEITNFQDKTSDGHQYSVGEIILVLDRGPDNSEIVARKLEETNSLVRVIWLSKNFGQHAATLAGMASTSSEWIVTMDEDGQHDPSYIGEMISAAIQSQATLVYAKPINPAPHGIVRNLASKFAKKIIASISGNSKFTDIQSYRLIAGDIGRSVAAYSGSGVYLDVALGWVSGDSVTTPVVLRSGTGRPSGYSRRSLFSHFLRMLISSGTKGLRFVSLVGLLFAVSGIFLAIYIAISSCVGVTFPIGWPFTTILMLIGFGSILCALGIIAEYLGMAVNMAMGKPPYLIISDPAKGPLGNSQQSLNN